MISISIVEVTHTQVQADSERLLMLPFPFIVSNCVL